MTDNDIDARLRAAATSWSAASVTTPTLQLAVPDRPPRRPRRWLVVGVAGLTAAAVVAVVTTLPRRSTPPVVPIAASTFAIPAPVTAAPTPTPTPTPTVVTPTSPTTPSPVNACAEASRTQPRSLEAADNVTAMWLCSVYPRDVVSYRVAVPDQKLAALAAAVKLPNGPPVPCPSPLAPFDDPLRVGAALADGTIVAVQIPIDTCRYRPEVRAVLATLSPYNCRHLLDTLDISQAVQLLPGGHLKESSFNLSGVNVTREIVYAFRKGEIRVSAGCPVDTMTRNISSKLVVVHGEQWLVTAGVRRDEGAPSPDVIVWPVPTANAWIEIDAGDHGQRLLGGSEMTDFAMAVRYDGRVYNASL